MIKATGVSVTKHGVLDLMFSDGSRGQYDMTELIERDGSMVVPLRSPDYFRRVYLELGAPTWPNGFDLAPWDIHAELSQKKLLRVATSAG